MKSSVLFYIIVPFLCSFINFFVTQNIITSLIVLFTGLLLLIIFTKKILTIFSIKQDKTRECITFINNFIITLSMNESILSTFEIVKESLSKRLTNQVKLVSHMSSEEQIVYLKKYFNLSIYDVFLNLLDQYIYNGGDILKISQILLFDARQIEEMLDNHISISIKKIFEFITLWGMTFIILIVIKISLSDYFSKIIESTMFTYGIVIFFLLFFTNLIIFINHAFNLDFIKVSKEEKINRERRKKNVKDQNANSNA